MQEHNIISYENLNDCQKEQAIDIFLEGFGHMMTFTKNRDTLQFLFSHAINPSLFICYIDKNQVLGILGIATNKIRPIKLDKDVCVQLFGKFKGNLIANQMNAIFQAPVVKCNKDLYIDVLATSGKARGKGVATSLLNHAFNLKEFDSCFLEVFSKNEAAMNLYKKMGFSIYKKKKFSFLTSAVSGMGYPIKMKKELIT